MTKLFLLIIISLIIEIEAKLDDADYYLLNDFINDNKSESVKVAGGFDSHPQQNLDYVRLAIVFQNSFRTCGGSLIKGLYVLTSASCLYDPFEGEAYAINITFPRNPELLGRKLTQIIHPNFNFETKENDIAIIQMEQPITPDGRSVDFAVLSKKSEPGAFVEKILRFCGMGSILNYPTFPSTLKCTDLLIVANAECGVDIKNILCSFWKYRDNNVCNGDYGGPLYEIVDDGVNKRQALVGIASFSPDARRGAPCLDNHKVVFSQVGAFHRAIEEFIGISLRSYSAIRT